MDPVTFAAAVFGVAGAVTVVQLSWKHLSKGVQFLDHSEIFSEHGIKRGSSSRFRIVVQTIPEEPDVDIVFIHGLNRHQWETHGTEGENSEWDKHHNQLQSRVLDLGAAKVMNYYYDTALRSSEFLLKRTLLHENKQLLDCLIHQRTEAADKRRPIIFVAHSLGGILLKNALTSSKLSENAQEREIYESTASAIFLNTPHQGSVDAIAHSVWKIVKPSLSDEQSQRATWEMEEFVSVAKCIGYHSERFKPIARSLPVVPTYIDTVNLENGMDGTSDIRTVYKALKRIRSQLKTTVIHLDTPTSAAETESSTSHRLIQFTVGTNLTAFDEFMPNDARCLDQRDLFHAKSADRERDEMAKYLFTETSSYVVLRNDSTLSGTNLAITFARNCLKAGRGNPYDSIFFIEASNQRSISMSFLHIYRKILEYHTKQLGQNEACLLLGVEVISNMSDDDVLSSPEILSSTTRATPPLIWIRIPLTRVSGCWPPIRKYHPYVKVMLFRLSESL